MSAARDRDALTTSFIVPDHCSRVKGQIVATLEDFKVMCTNSVRSRAPGAAALLGPWETNTCWDTIGRYGWEIGSGRIFFQFGYLALISAPVNGWQYMIGDRSEKRML